MRITISVSGVELVWLQVRFNKCSIELNECMSMIGGETSLVCETPVSGDVTGLEWVSRDILVVSTAAGEAALYRMGGIQVILVGILFSQ